MFHILFDEQNSNPENPEFTQTICFLCKICKNAMHIYVSVTVVLIDIESYLSLTPFSFSGKRSDKRVMKLLRGSERDLKLDITSAQSINKYNNINETIPKTPLPSVQIEGCKRFKSLCSRLVTVPKVVKREAVSIGPNSSEVDEISGCPQTRVDFHKTLSLLIRMGCDKQTSEKYPTRRHVCLNNIL